MWWDMILDTFWEMDDYDYSALTNDRQQIAETIYQTLSRILALDHRGCQWCALDVHRNELTDDERVQLLL